MRTDGDRKKPDRGVKKTATVVANNPDALKGVLKQIGGSQSDHWNEVLAIQALQALWLSIPTSRLVSSSTAQPLRG